MVILLCSIVAALCIGFTLAVRAKDVPPRPSENPDLKHLEDRKQVLYENMKDLQFEYHQGKLSDEDYESLKQRFQYDLAVVLSSIDRMGVPGRPKAPSAANAGDGTATGTGDGADDGGGGKKSQAASRSSNTCPSCQAANPAGNRFCGKCGKAIR